MILRAVARVVLPLTVAATLCLPVTGQNTGSGDATQSQANAPTLEASTSLNSNSNDVASLYGQPVEEIIARVNDRVITNSDLKRAQAQLAEEAHQGSMNLDQYGAAQKNLLRDLIDQQLLLSKGKQLSITGDTQLIKRLDQIRKQNHLSSMEDLQKAVEQSGTSYEDFKANIRNSLITQQVVQQQVGSRMDISQADVRKYYQDHQDSFTQPESVHLREILIPTSDDATPSQLSAADAKAKKIEAKLNAGGNFADMAKQFSGGPTAQQGGDLGDFKRGALAKVLEDKTFSLPVGGYTAPIRTRQGYIILQVTAHNPGGTPPLQKVEPKIEQALYMERIQPAVRTYLSRLRAEAYIDIRPGYTDSGASPNESKPTYTAYVPPQPKKKKKRRRFHADVNHSGRLSDRGRHVAAPAAAVSSGNATATSVAAKETKETHEKADSGHRFLFFGKKPTGNQNKRVKLRYGQPPPASVASQQVASAGSARGEAAAATAAAVASGQIQPLGPDLQHTPTITQPKEHKWRYSDEARDKSHEHAVKSHHRFHLHRAKKVKVDTAKPTPLTPAEAANQKVESAPLGLDGNTVHKKKKVKGTNGKKTRFSDERKDTEKKDQSAGTGNNSSAAPDQTAPTQPQ